MDISTFIKDSPKMSDTLRKISQAAGYLWERGWAEYNGGNISVNLTAHFQEAAAAGQPVPPTGSLKALGERILFSEPLPAIAQNIFYVTGTGKRMRDAAASLWENGSLIRISADGTYAENIYLNDIRPTSELPSHLMMHDFLLRTGRNGRVILHTHPTELIALSHIGKLMEGDRLTQLLWSMIPECRMVNPKGIGIVGTWPPGSLELARDTVRELARHDVILWEKHGILATGTDILDCFDVLDTLCKSAKIYLCARTAGLEP